MEKPYSYLQFLCALLMFFIIDVNSLLLDNSIEMYIKESIKMKIRTDILSNKDIENVKASIESIVFQYVGLLPDSAIIQSIDESLIDYSAENKTAILKDILFYQSKIKERDILEYLSDDFYKKHVDNIEYQVQHFDYDNIDSYYDATSKGKLPLYQLLEEQQYHQTLNIGFKTAQFEYKKQLQLILNEYENELNSISGESVEKEYAIHLHYSDATNRAFEKNKKALNAIFEQYDKALEAIFEQSKKGCSSFVKPEEKELAPVITLEEYLTELKSGSQPENKSQSEEDNQIIDSITLHINGFIPKETTLGTTHSGIWISEACVVKGGVQTCRKAVGQF